MSRLIKFGLAGLGLVSLITLIVIVCGGQAVYTAPLVIPFTVMILIGLNNRKRPTEDKNN